MSAAIVDLAAVRAARGLTPINPSEAFGPGPGKRPGDWVILPDGRRGIVRTWRPRAGFCPTLFVGTTEAWTIAVAEDEVLSAAAARAAAREGAPHA